MKNDRLKSILGIPYFLFLVIFVVCPVLILLYYAFTNGAGEFSLANFTLFFTDSKAIGTLIYSVMVAVVTTIVCLLIAYPVSYLLAKGEFRRGNVLLMLFVMPMWINFTLRITALKEILTLIEGNLAGNTHPIVAHNAPCHPTTLIPTKVAALIAIGPGVICEIVTRSPNSDTDSQ